MSVGSTVFVDSKLTDVVRAGDESDKPERSGSIGGRMTELRGKRAFEWTPVGWSIHESCLHRSYPLDALCEHRSPFVTHEARALPL